ncbi:putative tol protein [Rosellinia necatrix]|uniref:Putative tol protein n=1 Tax=Rosellinia necatrix TaxID=77044 RepID=A0A1W2TQJ3_ROSNE|nr:putative tol protein [Rosellinia necatrix]
MPQKQKLRSKTDSGSSDFFVAVVPNYVFEDVENPNKTMLKDMVSKQGFLMYNDEKTERERMLKPRLVSPEYDPTIIQTWLQVCRAHHIGCRFDQPPSASLILIDCRSRRILNASDIKSGPEIEYVSLSYVWGDNTDMAEIVWDGHNLPLTLPLVVQDAIQVTLTLGYYYLWVDKYCVDNRNKTKKHEQLMHMDSVYRNAALTIVAAAGTDESYGLPGVSKERPSRQLSFAGENYTLLSTLPLPHNSIIKSRWATRGWTYQEAILSKRRLVFTDDQLYFECNSTSCCESFDICFDDKKSAHQHYAQPLLFSLKELTTVDLSVKAARLSNLLTFLHCAEQYSQRTLRFDDDSLAAFSGIIRMLQSFTAFPVRHIWGIPFFHPSDDNCLPDKSEFTNRSFQVSPYWKTPALEYCCPTKSSPEEAEGADYLAFLMFSLGWRHDSAVSLPPRRRNNFPSWSWTGWEGSVAWPKLTEKSDIGILPSIETAISFGDTNTAFDPATRFKAASASLLSNNIKSLYIRTSAISRTAFVFDSASSMLLLSTGSSVRLYLSKAGLDASKVFKRIQSARYEAIPLATVGETTYMMLVKRYPNSYYRIGTMSVHAHYLTVPLFTSEVKTYKLR